MLHRVCPGMNIRECLTSLIQNEFEYMALKVCSSLMLDPFISATSIDEQARSKID